MNDSDTKSGFFSNDPGLRLFVSNIAQERKLFALAVLFACLGAVFEGVGLGLLVPFLKGLMEPNAAPLATGVEVIDHYVLAVDSTPLHRLYQVCGLILFSIGLRVTFGYLSTYVSVRMRENISHRLRCGIVDQLQAVALSYFSKKRSGEFLNNLTSQISRLRHLFAQATSIVQNGFLLLVYVAAIFWLSWQLALFAMAFCGALFLVMNRLLARLREQGKDIYETDREIVNVATEIVNGIRTIAAFGTRGYETGRFKEASAASLDAQVEAGRRSGLVGPLSQGVASTALIALIVIAVQFFVLQGTMSAAVLLAFFFALFRLLPLIQMLNNSRSQWAISRNALDEIAGMLATDDKPYITDGHIPFRSLQEGFELRNVDFEYEPNQPVLRGVDLKIPKGQTTAIVGSSGAGKTTLADLIVRLHDPTSGQVLLDEVDLRDYQISTLRNQIAVVSQSTFLFNTTVTANIAYGIADVSMDRVRWAAEKANALEFIEKMENGFNTVLGERGERLSGGQRQRVSIARALLRDPEVLILDEATSALDSVTEQLVQDSLEYLMQDRTVIVIAHRLSTIEHADQVVVLEDGKTVEQGCYSDLLNQKGQFWEYHSLQKAG